jgi:hypothetical protein
MTGQFLWLQEPRDPCRHTRVRLWNRDGAELRFVDTRSFGQMWFVPPKVPVESVITGLQKLGPEPFSDHFNGAYLKGKLAGSSRPIKNALLDQALVAGCGNIYADESLYVAGIRPRPAAAASTASSWTVCAGPWWRCWSKASEPVAPPSAISATSPAPTATTARPPGSTGGPASPAATAAPRSNGNGWGSQQPLVPQLPALKG